MRKNTVGPEGESRTPVWEVLEEVVREKAQEFIQQILEEEVTELLGREKSERRRVVDATEGYRNGYGKPRRLAMSSGTITLRRPRVRGLEERFESRVLPLFARRTKELGALLPELYLHGLAEGDFELAMRGLLGEGHRCRSLRFGGCGRDGRRSSRNGASVAWRVVRSSTCGRTGST